MTRGICSFKQECLACKLVERSERPLLCRNLRCQHLTICEGCGFNKDIGSNLLCAECNGGQMLFERSDKQGAAANPSRSSSTEDEDVVITVPGEAPSTLNESEKSYYERRWGEYDGYYRDPAAYAAVHYLILEEIRMNFIQVQIQKWRNQPTNQETWHKAKDNSLRVLESLKKQLPEKEARDENEEEKALCNIYHEYTHEQGKRSKFKVRRFFSNEAVALAPVLHFPVDLKDILEKCGFTTVNLDELIERYIVPEQNKTPEEILEFLGYRLKDEYAIPDKVHKKDF